MSENFCRTDRTRNIVRTNVIIKIIYLKRRGKGRGGRKDRFKMQVAELNGKNYLLDLTEAEGKRLLDFLAGREKIMPCPMIRDKDFNLVKDYEDEDFYLKMQEILYAMASGENNSLQSDCLATLIMWSMAWLESLGYDEEKRNELFRKNNELAKRLGWI